MLDENPDNATASHAVQLHCEGLGGDLKGYLQAAADAMEALSSAKGEGTDKIWGMLNEAGSDPKMIIAFLNKIVVLVCYPPLISLL